MMGIHHFPQPLPDEHAVIEQRSAATRNQLVVRVDLLLDGRANLQLTGQLACLLAHVIEGPIFTGVSQAVARLHPKLSDREEHVKHVVGVDRLG
jgi:hypothetical protein